MAQLSQVMTIYVGSTIYIAGITGGFLNILVFLTLRTFNEKSCGFYLIAMSFVNIGNLTTGLLSRILISGFHLDWTLISPFYCKFRWYGLQFGVLTSFTCTCLAATDQYLSTNSRIEWRRWSSIKIAHRVMAAFIIGWLFHGIPYLLYFDLVQSPIINKLVCASVNKIFQYYHSYGYLIIVSGIIPLVITGIFGLLARKNLRHSANGTISLVQRYLDQQLTKMVLSQLFYNFIFTFPYTMLTTILSFIPTVNDPLVNAKLDFANVMTVLIYYMSFASPFYIYTYTSQRFRQQLTYVLLDVHLKRWRRNPRIIINPVASSQTEKGETSVV
ncbi:unnamed protein product [Rotaria magnacalcarata]|uniref:G-protein coupled receptors family 1 profile domain-containing protein n=1 Tax=Rotaria magnacalcarata TaxID=392030 RepID=A0A819D4Q1_9BILA|nr:unnamed protein product [Rotaria magnacalcarata]CAF2185386.1 unnamed protein product [Rotaria magnacalcarata]CAF3831133.1 unnamed protein product [Rotaria magnacalcarata]CAF4305626.1 unnamed protein product [Rotaria magnacalcarata]